MITLSGLINRSFQASFQAGKALIYHRSNGFNVKEKDNHRGPQTIADLDAQQIIVSSILDYLPTLPLSNIVAEEGRLDRIEITYKNEMGMNLQDEFERMIPRSLKEVNVNELTFFIDPLDGTKEYVKNSDKVPMVMIGICLLGKPVVGLLHQPFVNKFYLGFEGGSCYYTDENKFHPYKKHSAIDELIVTTTNSHFTKEIKETIGRLEPSVIKNEGGCGYKVVTLLENHSNIYCYPSNGTSKWDTCAPEVCLRALGGELTDCYVSALHNSFQH